MVLEEWRPIVGFEGFYEVSNLGRVRTVARSFIKSNGQRCNVSARIRAICDGGKCKYSTINLSKLGKHSTEYVHQLVMNAFVGKCPSGMEVCHNNGNTSDNRLLNLRYDTRSGNQADRLMHGTSNSGVCHGMHKLAESQVLKMREEYKKGGVTYKELGERYGVTQSAIGLVIRRRRWAHI